MKILIAYSSKSGTTKECAEMLAKRLASNDITLACLEEGSPDITGFDIAIIGGYVRMGKISKNMRGYIAANANLLDATMHAFFICCGLPESTEYYFEKAIPKKLLDSSISNTCFGGDLRVSKQKGFDKFVARLVLNEIKSNNADADRNTDMSVPAILPENISRFADEIRHSF